MSPALRALAYVALALAVLLLPLWLASELGAAGAVLALLLIGGGVATAAVRYERRRRAAAGDQADAVAALRRGPVEPSAPATVALAGPVGQGVFLLAGLAIGLTAGRPLAYAGWVWAALGGLGLALHLIRKRSAP